MNIEKDAEMSFQSDTLCQNTGMMREAIVQIAKYSLSDIIITDENFNVVFHNDKYISDKQFITLFDIIDELLNDDFRIKLDNFKVSDKSHMYIKLLLTSSIELGAMPVDIHFCKIKNSKNQLKGFLVVLQDVVQEVRNRIQKETFVDIISHDLENPMRANIQILELILDHKFGYVNKELKGILDELLNSCKYMKYMADNLILKYKNEFEACELNKKKCKIINLVKDTCQKVMNILDRKKQVIELLISSKIPDVNIDKDEMEKVIKNLLINASNESRENSKIIIKIDSDNENVFVSFMNYGYTSNKAVLDNLFDEYISCSNKFRKIGFSLELFNCRKVIEAHGGNISAQNLNKNGKTITFSLPIN